MATNDAIIRDNSGRPITSPVGLYESFNEGSETIPGKTYPVKKPGILKQPFGDETISPYSLTENKVEVLEIVCGFAFTEINEDSWFTFKIISDQITTSRTFHKGINDNKESAYKAFLQKVEDYEKLLNAQKVKSENTKMKADALRAKTERARQIQAAKLQTLTELKALVKDMPIESALKDATVVSLIDTFNRYETLLKTL